jgi:hypothetical protein
MFSPGPHEFWGQMGFSPLMPVPQALRHSYLVPSLEPDPLASEERAGLTSDRDVQSNEAFNASWDATTPPVHVPASALCGKRMKLIVSSDIAKAVRMATRPASFA